MSSRAPTLGPNSLVQGASGRLYRVLRSIGSGGQVIAWLAEDASGPGRRYYVIREPRPDLDPHLYSLQVNRLRIAYDILYQLYRAGASTSYLVERIVDYYATMSGDYFLLVTEYVYGDVLANYTGCQGVMLTSECKRLISSLLRVVGFIHAAGVLHRDIKPRNIIRAPWGPVLIDFTTAKYFYKITLYEVTVYSRGGYTAPEQMKYRIESTQSDLWSIGATILYLATGNDPQLYVAGYPDRVRTPPRIPKGSIDPVLADLIENLMNPDPAWRPLSADEALKLLEKGEREEYSSAVISLLGREVYELGSKGVLGRDSSSDVYVGLDPLGYVSRHHALVFERDGEWFIQDLCSTNGTAVWRYGVDQGWHVVWPGRASGGRGCQPGKPVGDPVPLGGGALIALGYRRNLGPYLVAVFRAPRS